MPLYRASLQTLGAIVLLALALACHGKGGGSSSSTTATISGTVTYQRVPLVKDVNGIPTGLADAAVAANLVTLPAQGVQVRIYQRIDQTDLNGTTIPAWILAQTTLTDTTGLYSVTVTKDRLTMVEVLSTFNGGGGQIVQLVAERLGITSTTIPLNRVQYAMRKAVDGTALTNDPAHAAMLSANSVVNFSVGLNDAWWITIPAATQSTNLANVAADLETDPVKFPERTTGTGSRVLGIGDTLASFVTTYGFATPGATLVLHYWPGRSEPGGSYVVYDQSLLPQSLAAAAYFGTLRGGPDNDDAWDEGVILPLLARNVLYAGNLNRTYSVPLNPIFPPGSPQVDLSPEFARIEGLVQAMAANVLKSPYLADTQGTGLAAPLADVRDIGGLSTSQFGAFSAPAIRAFAWELILKANSLPSPGTSTDWAKIAPLAAARFFLAPGMTGVSLNGTARDLEPINVYSQIARIKEAKLSTEPVDLATVLTDSVLTSLGTPFGLSWPRPTTGVYASFASDWGTNPAGNLPPVFLSMAKATQLNGSYPNISQGELFYTGFNLSADRRCTLTAVISPALGAGAQVDVDLPAMSRTFSFTGSGSGQTSGTITIPVYNTAPTFHPVRLRLKSPAAAQPDVTVSLTLTPVS